MLLLRKQGRDAPGVVDHFKKFKPAAKVKVFLHSLAFGSLAPFIHNDIERRLTQKQMEMTMNVMAHSLVYWVRDVFKAGLFTRGSKIFSMTSSGSIRLFLLWRNLRCQSGA